MTATSASSSASTTTGPKVSLFAAKSGFVIPKNKLSGSLVPIFKGGKKPGGNVAVNGESTNQVQRKTKWGPDLTQDADVRRGRALAYQTRVDQIVQQLKSEIPEPGGGGDQATHEFNELEDLKSSSPPVHNKNTELLELEKQEAIGEILKLNPTYKVPADYKPLLKEITVPIPVKEYPGYNFIGLIFGHGSETQKRLEKETGAKIQVHGTKAHTGEKVEISSSDGNETQVVYEELSVLVTASTFEKVDEAVVLIELLLSSVSGNLAAGDNATVSQNQEASTPFMVSTHVNQGVLPPVTPQQGQFQYQNSWFPAATPQALVHQPSGLIPPQTFSAPILNNPVHVQSSSFNSSTMPSLFGPRPVQAFSNPYQPRNFPMPAPQPQFTGNLSQPTGLSVARPLLLQPLSSGPTGPPPDRPLPPSGISSGWPGAPSSVPASLGFGNMGQTTPPMVPPPGPRHAVPQLGFPSPAAPPNAISMNRPTTAPTFTSVPQPQAGPSSVPTPIQSSLGMPLPNSSITPAFGSAPISSLMMPASQATLQSGVVGAFPVTTSNFAPTRSPTITNAKVQHSGTGDFTFRPHHQQNPSPQIVPSFSSHHAAQNGPLPRPRMQTQTPQAPHFHMDAPNSTTQPGRQLFPPHVGNQRGQAPFVGNPTGHSLHPRLPPFSNASPGGPPVMQMGLRNFSSTPHLPNLTGPLPPRPGNPMQLQQNYTAPIAPRGQSIALNQQPFISSASARPPSFQGGQQVYDPFSPTSVSVASQRQVGNLEKRRKSENDPEYEDLMDSVGVK